MHTTKLPLAFHSKLHTVCKAVFYSSIHIEELDFCG